MSKSRQRHRLNRLLEQHIGRVEIQLHAYGTQHVEPSVWSSLIAPCALPAFIALLPPIAAGRG
jgi:hypothetical protein